MGGSPLLESGAHGEAVRLVDADKNRALALAHARFARYTCAKAHVVIERLGFERERVLTSD